MFRPALPNVPGGEKLNALVLNQRSIVGDASCGGPVIFGRSLAPKPRIDLPVPLLSMSGSKATVNGRPDCSVTIPRVCQPLQMVDTQPRSARWLRPLPKGRS